MARRKGICLAQEGENEFGPTEDFSARKPMIKGFNCIDERIMDGNWVNEPHSDIIQKFFRLLATCHTAIPDTVSYEAESQDEAAFVIAAREIG